MISLQRQWFSAIFLAQLCGTAQACEAKLSGNCAVKIIKYAVIMQLKYAIIMRFFFFEKRDF